MEKWKKRVSIVIVALVCLIFSGMIAMATETGTTDDGFKWMYEEGTMAITGYEGTATEINIPATINGIAVTLIHKSAFGGHSKITKVSIPSTVKTIGLEAFYGCTNLKSITIPNSVTQIGLFAFEECTSLTSVSIPNSVTEICDDAFYGCTSLTSVSIPNSVTYIGWRAFYGCTSLTSVSIPNSVTYIGWSAFYGCTSLTSVSIPNSVTEIGYSAFYGCTSLTSITIPNSTGIDDRAFGYYTNALGQENKVSGFTISGYYGTAAESYANDNGFTFIGTQSSLSDVAYVNGIDNDYTVVYTGSEIKPTIKVGYKNRKGDLTEGTDYTISYSNNVNAGIATITITGINHFKGTIRQCFRILPSQTVTISKSPSSVKAKVKKNKVTVSWKNIKKTEKAYKQIKTVEVQYSTDKKFKKNVKTKRLAKSKTKIVLTLKTNTTYYIRLRYVGNDKKIVSKWTKPKKVKTKK